MGIEVQNEKPANMAFYKRFNTPVQILYFVSVTSSLASAFLTSLALLGYFNSQSDYFLFVTIFCFISAFGIELTQYALCKNIFDTIFTKLYKGDTLYIGTLQTEINTLNVEANNIIPEMDADGSQRKEIENKLMVCYNALELERNNGVYYIVSAFFSVIAVLFISVFIIIPANEIGMSSAIANEAILAYSQNINECDAIKLNLDKAFSKDSAALIDNQNALLKAQKNELTSSYVMQKNKRAAEIIALENELTKNNAICENSVKEKDIKFCEKKKSELNKKIIYLKSNTNLQETTEKDSLQKIEAVNSKSLANAIITLRAGYKKSLSDAEKECSKRAGKKMYWIEKKEMLVTYFSWFNAFTSVLAAIVVSVLHARSGLSKEYIHFQNIWEKTMLLLQRLKIKIFHGFFDWLLQKLGGAKVVTHKLDVSINETTPVMQNTTNPVNLSISPVSLPTKIKTPVVNKLINDPTKSKLGREQRGVKNFNEYVAYYQKFVIQNARQPSHSECVKGLGFSMRTVIDYCNAMNQNITPSELRKRAKK